MVGSFYLPRWSISKICIIITSMPTKSILFGQTANLIVGLILLASLGFLGYRHYSLVQEFTQAKVDFATTTAAFEAQIVQLTEELGLSRKQNFSLNQSLAQEQDRNDNIARQVNQINQTISVLEKLSKTDEELLQKYSKVYFLYEHYIPDSTIKIDETYLYSTAQNDEIHTKVLPFLGNMLKAASSTGIKIQVISGYRSFGTQAKLKSAYTVVYGSGANQFSADQGYSEHQLGTTVDLTNPTVGDTFLNFEKTEGYKWLIDHAHEYGFTLSYPPNNKYYKYEPWHWRFVGIKLATRLKTEGKFFYDFDQRTIDQYLINIFDPA